MFEHDDLPVATNDEYSLSDNLDEEINHVLILIHNYTFSQKVSINPKLILLNTGSSIVVL